MADSDIFVSNDVQLDVDLGTMYVIDQGIVTKIVAKKYDPTKTYVVGEYVIYQEKLYKCNTAIEEPEEFDAEKWNNVLLADEVQIANANIALKANASDVYAKSETYNKTEVDTALASKADTATTYTKTEVDTALGDKADKSDTYTKTEVDTALSAKANSDDVYAKTDIYSKDEIDTNIYTKSETYNKNEVDGIINNLPAPMIFKGTLGVNGTITTLPTASSDNEGFTYKVITDGTYASISAKVGDMFTSNGAAWVHIPSGDETFTDTWRSIKVNGTEKLTGSITSGSVDFKNGTNSTAVFDPSDNSIKFNIDGYTQNQTDAKLADKADKSNTYTQTEVDNLIKNAISDLMPVDTASGAIAAFETNMADVLQEVKCEINATGGNGTPDNPNPINGYSSANITRCGVNLFEGNYPDIDNTVRYIHIKTGNGTLTLSSNCPIVEGAAILFFLEGNVSSGASTVRNGVSEGISRTVTTTDGYVTIGYRAYGTPTVSPADYNTQLEFGSQATTYHAYTGNTYTIAFGQTVYGGVLDVTRGKLKPCIEYPSYNGETLSGRWLSSEATYIEGTTPPTGSQVVSLDDYGSDIDLTPEVISVVVGTNNVYSDTNGNTTVKFKDSIQHYIDKHIT